MRRIEKTVSLESITSRLPSIWPSYYNDELYTFGDDELKKRNWEHATNWGMLPLNVFYNGKEYSFGRISMLYHFFNEYHTLLNKGGHCSMTYSSATDYYERESGTKYADQLKYGTDRETYEELDKQFDDYGGEVFYEWITTYVVPSFDIPKEYQDYWKCEKIFYGDVVRWLAWFSLRDHYNEDAKYDEDTNTWNCQEDKVREDGSCCDCEEYFSRGGLKIFESMKSWYEGIQAIVDKINSLKRDSKIYFPILIQASVDNMGESSIFSKEYVLGEDYSINNIAVVDGDPMFLNNGRGYVFDDIYMEAISDGWKDYTDKYINENKGEFYINAIRYFAFDEDNKKYYSTKSTLDEAKEDLRDQMSKRYPLIFSESNLGWILIDGTLYPIEEIEYGVYDTANPYIGGKTYMVYREEGTNTPYTVINGERVYAEFYIPQGKYYFPFFKNENAQDHEDTCSGKTFNFNDFKAFGRIISHNDTLSYINYDGTSYNVKNDSVAINGTTYPRVSAHTANSDVSPMYVMWKNNEIMSGEAVIEKVDNASIEDKVSIKIEYPFDVVTYPIDEINGTTVSKLDDLKVYDTLSDDIGNVIDGVYNISDRSKVYNHQPPQGTELEPLYQVGNTANIQRFSLTAEDLNDVKGSVNYFVGDIITEMSFYYKELNGTIAEDTRRTVTLNKDTAQYTSLSAIKESRKEKEALEANSAVTYIFQEDVFCDITYCIGATLSRKEGERFLLSVEKGKCNHGVEYKETVNFVKEEREYYLKKPRDLNKITPSERNNVENHSISYPITVYALKQNENKTSSFKTNINIFSGNTDTYTSKFNDDMEKHNAMRVYPTFMEEYRMGNSVMEKVDSDIYIDRGINAAFEKHLKLGEVTSLESLEQYGNGFFEVMES